MIGWRRISVAILAAACSMLCASAARAGTVSPLPASDYAVQSACAAPAPGHAGCLAQLLEAETAAARAHTHPLGITSSHPITAKASEGAYGLRPQDLRNAYFPGEQPYAPASEPQTIALVDSYNDLEAEADLKVYDEEFNLPECTTGNGCFEQVNQNGEMKSMPYPSSTAMKQATEALCESKTAEPAAKKAACKEAEEADGWALEISLDIEVAHAVCQTCHIALVEADNGENANLEMAEDTAAEKIGATEISNSWGGEEPLTDSGAFNHPGTVITVATGDSGYLNWDMSQERAEKEGLKIGGVNYPASSPHVVAVGGTNLKLNGAGETWSEETVWADGGSGCSLNFKAQSWQSEVPDWSSVGCGTGSESKRAVADIAADADPYTGVAVYDSVPYVRPGSGLVHATVFDWTPIGGTSAASPIIASMFALAGGSHGVEYPAQTLYSHLGSASLHDVTEGANGKCGGKYSSGCVGSMSPLSPTDCGQGVLICNAATGYDGPSGVGTPNGVAAFKASRLHTGGGPEAPLSEECGGPLSAGADKICGTLNPHSSAKVGYYFAYNKGASCTGGKETPLQPEVQGQDIGVSGELFGLEPHTQYTFCLIATDSSGETLGTPVTFATEAAAPAKPQTRRASDVTAVSATLNGTLQVQLIQTSWYFQYAASESSCTGAGAKTTPEEEDKTIAEPDEVSTPVSNLQPGTWYTFCLVAKNRIGSTTSFESWFVTKEISPTIDSVSVESTGTEATFEAKISPNAQEATCEVLYGTSESYGSEVPCEESLGSGGNRTLANAHIASLESNTTYYYQIVADNKAGASSASEGKGTFTTQPMSTPGGSIGEEKSKEKTVLTAPISSPIVSTLAPVAIPTTPSESASITIVKVEVGWGSMTVMLRVSQAGTVTISGPGCKTTRKSVVAGTIQIKVALNRAGKNARKHHKKVKIMARLKAASETASASKTLKL
jgi:hypothetical protein